VRHDNTVTWLAGWKENVQDQNKYVMLSAETHIKGRSDMKKYEKARELKKHVVKIREDYTADLKSKAVSAQQDVFEGGSGGSLQRGAIISTK
jgi:DNA topoisomerase-1